MTSVQSFADSCRDRLAQMPTTPGWLNGDGAPTTPESKAAMRTFLGSALAAGIFHEGGARPGLYPLEDGGMSAEWFADVATHQVGPHDPAVPQALICVEVGPAGDSYDFSIHNENDFLYQEGLSLDQLIAGLKGGL